MNSCMFRSGIVTLGKVRPSVVGIGKLDWRTISISGGREGRKFWIAKHCCYSSWSSMPQFAKVATCALDQWALDFEGNLARTKRSIEIAKEQEARYLVGPELQLCGYGCEDHFLEIDTFNHSSEALAELLQSGIMEDIICDIGMPILHNSVAYNCRVICLGGQVICIRPKLFLADDGNYREARWFTRWKGGVQQHKLDKVIREATGQTYVPFGDVLITTTDTKISSETCEELFTPASPHINLGLIGVEILGNGSGSHHELRKLHTRVDLIRSATEKSGGVYLYANQIGCDGGRLLFDGCALIVANGKILAQGSQFALTDVEVISAVIDLEEIRSFRISKASRGVQASEAPSQHEVQIDFTLCSANTNIWAPTRPIQVQYHQPEQEIAYGPACWLWDYLRRTGASGFFLPLSGGADSSSTASIVGAMCQLVVQAVKNGDEQVLRDARRITGHDPETSSYLPTDPKEFCGRIMHTCYLGTCNSSQGTQDFAKDLADTIGSYHMYVNIDPVIAAILALFKACSGREPRFRVHGGTFGENQALQNIQARFRMLFSYFLAQLLPWLRGNSGYLLVLGSGNVDEGLRGYLTKYDCSSADLNPIGGVSKVDLKRFLYWAAGPGDIDCKTYESSGLGFTVLKEIASAPPTAELEPITDQYIQRDEEDMGMTYEELGIYGRLRKVHKSGPVTMFRTLVAEWPHLPASEVAEKVKFFFTKYAQNRHKATTLTPSVHCESYGVDDNRFDLRPIFIHTYYPWQFKRIDEMAKQIDRARAKQSSKKPLPIE